MKWKPSSSRLRLDSVEPWSKLLMRGLYRDHILASEGATRLYIRRLDCGSAWDWKSMILSAGG